MADDKELDDGLTEEERAALKEDGDDGDGKTPEEIAAEEAEAAAKAKADAEAAAVEAAAKAGDAAGGDDKPKEPPAEENLEPEIVAQQGAPILVVEPPADADAKLKEIGEKKDALITQFDDGDITAKEYQQQIDALAKQEREIERAVERATLAAEMEQQRLKNEWLSTVNSFIDANPVYRENQRLYRALDQEVRDVANSEEGKTMTGAKILAKAHENLAAAFNLGVAKDHGQTTKPPKTELPPSLHGVPAADANDVSNNKYAALDRLASTNPIAYEEALMKLPEEERNAYLASA